MSVRSSVRLKISVTTDPIEFYFSGNIPAPVVVLGYFLGGWDIGPNQALFVFVLHIFHSSKIFNVFGYYTIWAENRIYY